MCWAFKAAGLDGSDLLLLHDAPFPTTATKTKHIQKSIIVSVIVKMRCAPRLN